MLEYTVADWQAIPCERKGLWFFDLTAAPDSPENAVFGKRWVSVPNPEKPTRLTEGLWFILKPTDEELLMMAREIQAGISKNITRGFHLWQFTGAFVLDDNCLLTATTRQDNMLDVEARFFTDATPRWRERIDELTIKRVCRNNDFALAERLRRLFALMSRPPKGMAR